MKVLLSGAGLALVAGLSMGAAMQPHLDAVGDDRPEGPQIFTHTDGPTGPFDDSAAYASYRGNLPDYVVGTDFRKATTAYQPRYAETVPEPRVEAKEASEGEPEETETIYRERGPEPLAYSSMRSDPYADDEAQPPDIIG